MSKVIIGLYKDINTAHDVIDELQTAGFDRGDISLLARDPKGDYARDLDREGRVGDDVTAGKGALVGGIGGLLIGLGALAIPGIGPVIAAGPLVAGLTGAAAGAATGGIVGAMIDAGVPDQEAEYYAEGVRRGGFLVSLHADDEDAREAIDIMNRHHPIDVRRQAESWRSEGWTGFDETASDRYQEPIIGRGSMTGQGHDDVTIPVVEEDIAIDKREKEHGGVRVRSRVEEEPVDESVTLREEKVRVERHPVDRPISSGDRDAFKEETFEVTEHSEEPVVHKSARVKEEVSVHKDVDERTEHIRDTVKKTVVDVEKVGETAEYGEKLGDGWDRFEPTFRRHYSESYGGGDYEQYRPAYRYGYDLAGREQYGDRSWHEFETDVRSDWEKRHPDSAWDEVKHAVCTGWASVRGKEPSTECAY